MSDRRRDLAWATAVAMLVFVRLLFAGDDFSYDHANYITYFGNVDALEWSDLWDLNSGFFPYVFMPGRNLTGGGLFEVGFVALVKLCKSFIDNDVAVYALIAALSVGLRVWVLRAFRVPWLWILASQVVVITLFEANALRAGVAVSLFMLALLLLRSKRPAAAALVTVVSGSFHLQSFLFSVPFLGFWAIRGRLAESRRLVILAAAATFAAVLVVAPLVGVLGLAKAEAYVGGETAATGGLNLISVSGALFVGVGLYARPGGDCEAEERRLWMAAAMASVLALALLIVAVSLSSVGMRAWQFAFVVLGSLVWTRWIDPRQQRFAVAALALVTGISIVNVLLRYPLSNFFDFVVPHVRIIPLVVV